MSIQLLLLKQREEFEKLTQENINDLIGGVYGKFPEKDKLLIANNRLTSFLSTIQQEILQAMKKKLEKAKWDSGEMQLLELEAVVQHNKELSDLSSWLEGEKK